MKIDISYWKNNNWVLDEYNIHAGIPAGSDQEILNDDDYKFIVSKIIALRQKYRDKNGEYEYDISIRKES